MELHEWRDSGDDSGPAGVSAQGPVPAVPQTSTSTAFPHCPGGSKDISHCVEPLGGV